VVAKIEERKAQDERERLLREQALAERQRTRAKSEQFSRRPDAPSRQVVPVMPSSR
jgi:hypothetical protein